MPSETAAQATTPQATPPAAADQRPAAGTTTSATTPSLPSGTTPVDDVRKQLAGGPSPATQLMSIITTYNLTNAAYYSSEEARASAKALADLSSKLDGLDAAKRSEAMALIGKWHHRMALNQKDSLVKPVNDALCQALQSLIDGKTVPDSANAGLEAPKAGAYLAPVIQSYHLADAGKFNAETVRSSAALEGLVAGLMTLPLQQQEAAHKKILAWHMAMAADQTDANILAQNTKLAADLNAIIAQSRTPQTQTPAAPATPNTGAPAQPGTNPAPGASTSSPVSTSSPALAPSPAASPATVISPTRAESTAPGVTLAPPATTPPQSGGN